MDGAVQNTNLLVVLLSGAVGAIIGALIPVLIQPYFGHRAKLHKQKVAHANRLNRVELNLLDIDSGLHDNIFAVQSIINAVKNSNATNLRPLSIKVDDDAFSEIMSAEINEKLHSLRYDLRRFERDANSFNKLYDILTTSYLNNSINADTYEIQIKGLTAKLPLMIKHIERMQKDCLKLLGMVRARQYRDKTWVMRHRTEIQQRWLKDLTEEEIELWEKKHINDIEENSKRFGS